MSLSPRVFLLCVCVCVCVLACDALQRRRVSFNAMVWEAEYEKSMEESVAEYNKSRELDFSAATLEEPSSADVKLDVHPVMLNEFQEGPALKIKEKEALEEKERRRQERAAVRMAQMQQASSKHARKSSTMGESRNMSLSEKRALREAKEHGIFVGGRD